MLFVDELRAYLKGLDGSSPALAPDVAEHRRHLVERLIELEKAGTDESQLEEYQALWDAEQTAEYVHSIRFGLLQDFGRGASREQLAAWLNIALDREIGLDSSSGSAVRDREIDRIRDMYWTHEIRVTPDDGGRSRYARGIRAIRDSGQEHTLTPIGRLILELPDRDAVRWLLAAEVVQADGPDDDLRLCRQAMNHLLAHPVFDEPSMPFNAVKLGLSRLVEMGLVGKAKSTESSEDYELTPGGRALFEELAGGEDTPFTVLVQAILQDETASVVERIRPMAASLRMDISADATARSTPPDHFDRVSALPVGSKRNEG